MGGSMAVVRCPSCDAEIPADDVNIERLVAKCRHCNTVFGFAAQLGAEALQQVAPALRTGKRPEVPMPPTISMTSSGKTLEVTLRWFSWTVLALAFFCVFWDGFMVVWYVIALSEGVAVMAVAGLLHLAVGVGLTYFCLASWLNSTRITLDGMYLRIEHGPLPWPGGLELPTSNIEQLFTKQVVHRGKHGPHYSFELHAALRDGSQRKLLSGLSDAEQALYIEQEAERFLGVEDRAVSGEISR